MNVVYGRGRQRGCRHAKVSGISVWNLLKLSTRISFGLQSCQCATTGGAGKICCSRRVFRQGRVSLARKMRLLRELKGRYVRTRGILSLFSCTSFTSASWRLTKDTLSQAFCSKSGFFWRLTNSFLNPTMLTAEQHFFIGAVSALIWVVMKCPRP